MSHAFSFKSGLLTLTLGAAAAFAVLTPAPDAKAGDDDKKVACDKLGDLKDFCTKVEGKPGAIRKVMKAAQKAYNEAHASDEIKCTTCHENGNGTGAFKKAESDKRMKDFAPLLKAAIAAHK